MNIKPLGDRIAVRQNDAEAVTPGGIIIPDNAKELPTRGEVVALGTDLVKLDGIAVGDTVLYSKYGGTEVSLDGDDLIVLQSHEVLAVVE